MSLKLFDRVSGIFLSFNPEKQKQMPPEKHRIMKHAGLLLAWTIFLTVQGAGQSFRMAGKIRCYQTKKSISAKVSFEKQPDAAMTFVSHSGEEGYSATIARPGTYLLKASMPGYLPEFHELNLDHDSLRGKDAYKYDFSLIPITLNQILPFRNIIFDPSSAALSRMAQPELYLLAEILRENPGISIRLEGHTDNIGKSRSSISLAKKRIKAVKKFLLGQAIQADRIELKAFGGGNPLFKTGTPEAHQANRRVEIRIIDM